MIGRLLLAAIILNLTSLVGCDQESQKTASVSPTAQTRRAAVSLKLLVVGDPQLAEAVRLQRGEWAERSGGELIVQEVSREEFQTAELPNADVIIYPTQYLAELVVGKQLRTIRQSVLDDSRFVFDDLLPVVRNEVMRYGGEFFAISLGEAPLMLARVAGSDDETEAEAAPNRAPTWTELAKLHLEGRPAEELIARAASFVDPQLRSELLFDPKDMNPRLTAPHFRRALEQMALGGGNRPEAGGYKVACPTASALGDSQRWRLSRLPQAEETYNSIRERWEPQTLTPTLAVIGFAGRAASVTSSTRNATSAFKLLGWLGSGTPAIRISSSSEETTFFRNSQRRQSEKWLGRSNEGAAAPIAALLSTDEPFLMPRIPEIDRYLDVLDETLKQDRALKQEDRGQDIAELLESVSKRWQELTEKLGRERQLHCYRLHLGLESWSD